jgi:hypothetical protein
VKHETHGTYCLNPVRAQGNRYITMQRIRVKPDIINKRQTFVVLEKLAGAPSRSSILSLLVTSPISSPSTRTTSQPKLPLSLPPYLPTSPLFHSPTLRHVFQNRREREHTQKLGKGRRGHLRSTQNTRAAQQTQIRPHLIHHHHLIIGDPDFVLVFGSGRE